MTNANALPIQERLRKACNGQPATIPWPHRVLHDAADKIDVLEAVLREAGDVIESYYKSTGIDLGDASRMPFYADTMARIDAALGEGE